MGAITPLKTLFIYAKAHAVVHPNSNRDNNPPTPRGGLISTVIPSGSGTGLHAEKSKNKRGINPGAYPIGGC